MSRLTELQVFAKVAEELSLTQASDGLGLSVSRVSRHLSALEQRLHVRLIQRTTRQMHLTPEGVLFAARAREILAELHAAEEHVSTAAAAPRGLLRIGASMSFAMLHLMPVIEAFRRDHPLVQVELQVANRYGDLVEQGLDLAIRTRRVESDSSLTIRKLAEVDRVMVAAPGYVAQHGSPAHPGEIAGHDLLLYSLSDDWERLPLTRGAESVVVPVTGAMVANDGQLLVDAALRGMGITVQPVYIVHEDLKAGRLVRVLPDWALPRLTMNLAFPSRSFLPARTRLFIEALSDHFAANRLQESWSAV